MPRSPNERSGVAAGRAFCLHIGRLRTSTTHRERSSPENHTEGCS